ncbi:NAD(P)-binding protein [Endozoicomonas sp. G2_1]|uniref:NAD(P)-binding protein n=1 Tax=Endozoicomonas sp. G2_1 TaxID=2821091 RepID=UPI001ADAE2AA|nr:NAD(P)-binding protein [Endozoicomonas sp. G2_1]MBO9489052.1 NAD(P)-binding protein [Endozoicomonas sp. G2_1]
MMKKHLVVGGGIAGLLAAILLKKRDATCVTLIESNNKCGGLLRSIKTADGVEFDYGTHILGETGIDELDNILFERVTEKDWYKLPILKPGNYINGYLHKYSQLIYAKALPENVLINGAYELLSSNQERATQSQNLLEYCQASYGDTFTEKLFTPLIEKLFDAELIKLDKSALGLFGYNRIIIGNQAMMKRLKADPYYDSILAYETYDEGVSSLNNYYPKHGKGIGLWIDNLQVQAEELGVKVITEASITKLNHQDNQVTGITLANGEQLEFEQLVWTAPSYLLIKLAGLDFVSNYQPRFRHSCLHHFVFDRAFNTHNFHVYCNDADMSSFRITLYPNISNNNDVNGPYRCTVEVLTNKDICDELDQAQVYQELITMGIVETSAKLLYKTSEVIKNGFPVYTCDFVAETKRQNNCITSNLKNVQLLGKASSKTFFMSDVLQEVYRTIQNNPL